MAWFITVESVTLPGRTAYVHMYGARISFEPGMRIDPQFGVPTEAIAEECLAVMLTKYADLLEAQGVLDRVKNGVKIVFRENNLEPEAQDEANNVYCSTCGQQAGCDLQINGRENIPIYECFTTGCSMEGQRIFPSVAFVERQREEESEAELLHIESLME
tara:strand:- start:88 stop:567 length:480 start_codon:yes stop_codon:yes gene_type:complete